MLSIYTQKKKFSQYLCFLIKSTILDISLSNCVHELYYRSLLCDKYCLYYNPFLVYCRELALGTVSLTGDRAQGDDNQHDSHYRLHQPLFKIHDVHVCGKPVGLFSHMVFDIERELFLLQ